jgi:hypothetical protein
MNRFVLYIILRIGLPHHHIDKPIGEDKVGIELNY